MLDSPSSEARLGLCLDRLLEVSSLLGADTARELARLGISESRAHLLWVLGAEGPCPQRDLARALAVSPRTVTGLVDGLSEQGLVTREPHPTDRRASLVTPTSRGREVIDGFRSGRARLARQLFADLPEEVLPGWETGTDRVLDRLRALVGAEAGDEHP